MEHPVVSIIIPNYNYGRYLGQAVDSVLAQTYRDVEVLVVDDGSTDDSASVAARYGDQVRWLRQERQGVSAARNRGARECRGTFVAFLDADDSWSPDKLERQLARFAVNPELGLVHCGESVVDASGRELRQHLEGLEGWVATDLLEYRRLVIIAPGSTVLVRRDVFESVGGFDPELSTFADWDFSYRVAARYPVGFVPKVLVTVRSHEGSMQRNVAAVEHDMMLAYTKAFRGARPELARLRRRCFGRLHMLLAGSFMTTGSIGRGGVHLAKALWNAPENAARLPGAPIRWWRRRKQGGRANGAPPERIRTDGEASRMKLAEFLIKRLGTVRLQPMYQGLLQFALLGMNVGGGTQKLEWSGEIWVMQYLRRLLASSGRSVVVFDVGAHSGKYAETVLSIFGRSTRVHCFEPAPATCDTLRQRFNGAETRVHVHELALGKEAGKRLLYANPERSGLASLFNDRFEVSRVKVTETREVDVARLDKICEQHAVERIHFLKIDAEGAEFEVLEGAGRMLAEERIDVIQFEFGECHVMARTFFHDFYVLLSPGYALYRILPRGLMPLGAYRPSYDIFVSGTNYLAIARRLKARP